MTDQDLSQTATDIKIQPFGAEHIPGALLLSQEVSWPHKSEDWALTLSVSRGVVAFDGEAIVGTALCSPFGDVSSVSMIIVARRCRGCGLGRRLMNAVLALAGEQEQRLTATEDGLPLYKKLGFVPVGQVLQHQGIARASVPVQAVGSGSVDDLAAFSAADLDASGLRRDTLLRNILSVGEMLVTEGGFAMLRPFGRGQVVGPVVARDAQAAQALIAEAGNRCEGRFLRVDLSEQSGLSGHATSLGLDHAGGGVAMVRNAGRALPRAFKTYALTSQALG